MLFARTITKLYVSACMEHSNPGVLAFARPGSNCACVCCREGFIFDTLPDGKVWNGSEVIRVELDDGVTWDDINIIAVW